MKVYLAGGIENVKDPFSWRALVTEKLANHGIEAVDPLRDKRPEEFDTFNEREIVLRDKQDIRECDLVFAEITETDRPYIGTAMEILYAWEREKPVVVWGTYKSYFLTFHSVAQFGNLNDCINYILKCWASKKTSAQG